MRFSGILASFAVVASKGAWSKRLDVIELPMGFFPEGITLGREWTAYVGSLADGSIWKGDLSTGEGEVVVQGTGSPSIGMDYDRRSGYLFVAGGPSGTARVYDESFELLIEYALAGENDVAFVNDAIITDTAVYFTDSFQRKIYSVKLNKADGGLADGLDQSATTILLSSNFPLVPGAFNANGIEAADDGTLIVVNAETGGLYTVDPETGIATAIDLGGDLVKGDGLVLRKNTLWAVDNGSGQQITEISLSPDLTCGSVAPRGLTSELFNSPTTAARKGNSLYVVNAKFAVPVEDISTTPYEIVRVDRDAGVYACSAE